MWVHAIWGRGGAESEKGAGAANNWQKRGSGAAHVQSSAAIVPLAVDIDARVEDFGHSGNFAWMGGEGALGDVQES